MTTNIASIDVGYSNMAIVVVDTDFIGFIVKSVHKINLYDFNEREVHLSMIKFISCYGSILQSADIILVERQPPQGLTNIQDVIAYNFPNKVKLICPRSVHKHLMISKFDYELRKKHSVKVATEHLNTFPVFEREDRKHDIADAFCQCLYYIEINKVREAVTVKLPDNIQDFFESFKYTPK